MSQPAGEALAVSSPLRLYLVLLFTLRGSVCLYQGEELGLPEAALLDAERQDPYGRAFWPDFKGRDGCRTPMPWENAVQKEVFTRGTPGCPSRLNTGS